MTWTHHSAIDRLETRTASIFSLIQSILCNGTGLVGRSWRISSRNVTSDDLALNWDTAQHVTGNSRGPVAAVSLSPKWSGLDVWKTRLCRTITMHRTPPWLLLHLHHLFYWSLCWEGRGNNIIFAGSCVSHWKNCYSLLKVYLGLNNHSFICAFVFHFFKCLIFFCYMMFLSTFLYF